MSGTSLVAVVTTALASSYTYLTHGVVDTAAALLISCCAVLTAPLGANLTATLNPQVSNATGKRGTLNDMHGVLYPSIVYNEMHVSVMRLRQA